MVVIWNNAAGAEPTPCEVCDDITLYVCDSCGNAVCDSSDDYGDMACIAVHDVFCQKMKACIALLIPILVRTTTIT